jgi:hypothetical protein
MWAPPGAPITRPTNAIIKATVGLDTADPIPAHRSAITTPPSAPATGCLMTASKASGLFSDKFPFMVPFTFSQG